MAKKIQRKGNIQLVLACKKLCKVIYNDLINTINENFDGNQWINTFGVESNLLMNSYKDIEDLFEEYALASNDIAMPLATLQDIVGKATWAAGTYSDKLFLNCKFRNCGWLDLEISSSEWMYNKVMDIFMQDFEGYID